MVDPLSNLTKSAFLLKLFRINFYRIFEALSKCRAIALGLVVIWDFSHFHNLRTGFTLLVFGYELVGTLVWLRGLVNFQLNLVFSLEGQYTKNEWMVPRSKFDKLVWIQQCITFSTCSTLYTRRLSSRTTDFSWNHWTCGGAAQRTLHSIIIVFFFSTRMTLGFSRITGATNQVKEETLIFLHDRLYWYITNWIIMWPTFNIQG